MIIILKTDVNFDRRPLEVRQSMRSGNHGSDLQLSLFINKVMVFSVLLIAWSMLILLFTPMILSRIELGDNAHVLLQDVYVLGSCYCVVVQFEVDIDAVEARRHKAVLMLFECNNFFADHCCLCWLCCGPRPVFDTVNVPAPTHITANATHEVQMMSI